MRYILDASVALKWVLDEPDSAHALMLRIEYGAGIHELIAPDIFPVEIAHALSKGFRQGKLSEEEADAHLASLLLALPQLVPSFDLLAQAFEISQQTRTGVYDALYLAVGEKEQLTVLTADRKLAKLPYKIIDISQHPYAS